MQKAPHMVGASLPHCLTAYVTDPTYLFTLDIPDVIK